MKIAIIDDNPAFAEDVKIQLMEKLHLIGLCDSEIAIFGSSEEYLGRENEYQLLITEIQLPNMSGIDLARKIREQDIATAIVFLSADNFFAMETYEVDALYYIHKPVTDEKMNRLVKKIGEVAVKQADMIMLPDGFRCSLRDIHYLRQNNQYSIVYLAGKEVHVTPCRIEELEDLLKNYSEFYRIQDGPIVNLKKILEITSNSLLLENDHYVSVSKGRYKDLKEAYSKYVFRHA